MAVVVEIPLSSYKAKGDILFNDCMLKHQCYMQWIENNYDDDGVFRIPHGLGSQFKM